jgi:hypothetical protein
VVWGFLGGLAAGASLLVARALYRQRNQDAAARAAGLEPIGDLMHVPESLQRTALWALADGGFERRILNGRFARAHGDVEITAFDLETLRERRGEWAYLPVEPPFRIGGVLSVVVCEVDRQFPHVLLKRAGRGDELIDDDRIERMGHIAKNIRDRLGVARSYASELPATLATEPLAAANTPEQWRVYTRASELVDVLFASGLRTALELTNRRDLVVELLDRLIVVYPAAREVAGADAFADLTTTALQVVDGVLAASPPLTPRGVEQVTSS